MSRKVYDFRGGYATDLAPELMDDNMLLEAQNIYYKGGLKKRPGWTNLSTDATVNGATVRGFTRAYINGGWYNVVALDDGSDVNFYYGNTGSYTAIDNSFDWTTGTQVEMRFFIDAVIAVNGTDKPAIINYDSGWQVQNLETYDTRTRANDEWYAGQWDDSETPAFVDDTSDAQSPTADDFSVATATNNDGFYVAGVTVFNKIIIKNCPDLGTSVTAEYAYYAGGGTWTTFTPGTVPNWVSADADKTIEFDLPLDTDGTLLWEKYGDLTTQTDPTGVPGGTLNRYVFRVRFTTADTAGSADGLEVYHTQYLTQIFLNDKPSNIEIHQNRVFLSTGNAFRYSPPNSAKGWYSDEIEYCIKCGKQIKSMVSVSGYLAILKEGGIYRYEGTTTDNFVLRYTECIGGISPRGAATIAGGLIYVAKDGIRAYNGTRSVILSRHIQSDIDSYTLTNSCIVDFDGAAVVSFPTNSKILWFDPDTLRQDDMGDGRVSFYEWTGVAVTQFIYATGAGDNGYLIGSESDRFIRNTTNGYDVAFNTTQTAITTTLQTKHMSIGEPAMRKRSRRVKVELSKSGNYTLTMYANEGQVSASDTIASGSGSGHYIADETLPYTMDGYNVGFKLVNGTTNTVEIYGFAFDVSGRTF